MSNADASPQAVIFDMDGVIIDSETRHERAFLQVCAELGFEKHGLHFPDYIGRSDSVFWADFTARNNVRQTVPELQQLKRNRVLDCFRRERPFYPGVQELIDRLRPYYRLALASGSERLVVDAVLEIAGLAGVFEASVTSSEVPKGKPEPEIFLRTAALLGVAPASCWVIEDSKPGIAAGLAAGMRVIAIANTHRVEELTQAHHVVSSCAEISELLAPR